MKIQKCMFNQGHYFNNSLLRFPVYFKFTSILQAINLMQMQYWIQSIRKNISKNDFIEILVRNKMESFTKI
jgi:hypothetical protein